MCCHFFTFSWIPDRAQPCLNHGKDKPGDILPPGDLPLLIVRENNEDLAKVTDAIIDKFGVKQEDSVIIATEQKHLSLSSKNKITTLDYVSDGVNGIEAQWMIIDVSDQVCGYETLSRGRKGLVLLVDIPFKASR